MKPTTKIAVGIFIFFLITVVSVTTGRRIFALTPTQKTFTVQELRSFDGTVPGKPIYLAMNGLVYDVTPGSEYYRVGGPYHDLAGRESGPELNVFGGAIIKRKYQVIGKLSL